MKTQAVVDRFEGDMAVVMVADEGDQLIVPRNMLPAGVKEGDWLQIEVEDDRVIRAELDAAATARANERIEEKLARLKGK